MLTYYELFQLENFGCILHRNGYSKVEKIKADNDRHQEEYENGTDTADAYERWVSDEAEQQLNDLTF